MSDECVNVIVECSLEKRRPAPKAREAGATPGATTRTTHILHGQDCLRHFLPFPPFLLPPLFFFFSLPPLFSLFYYCSSTTKKLPLQGNRKVYLDFQKRLCSNQIASLSKKICVLSNPMASLSKNNWYFFSARPVAGRLVPPLSPPLVSYFEWISTPPGLASLPQATPIDESEQQVK